MRGYVLVERKKEGKSIVELVRKQEWENKKSKRQIRKQEKEYKGSLSLRLTLVGAMGFGWFLWFACVGSWRGDGVREPSLLFSVTFWRIQSHRFRAAHFRLLAGKDFMGSWFTFPPPTTISSSCVVKRKIVKTWCGKAPGFLGVCLVFSELLCLVMWVFTFVFTLTSGSRAREDFLGRVLLGKGGSILLFVWSSRCRKWIVKAVCSCLPGCALMV